MSIFNSGNFFNPFNVSQPQLNSSDRTAYLKSKTKYAAAVNLAKNGGVLTKRDGSKYVGTVQTTSTAMTSASSYADLLDVTKGKYLLTPPPSSNLSTSFHPTTGDVFYGNFTVTNYTNADVPYTMLGIPTVISSATYKYPNQLVSSGTAATAATVGNNRFNTANIVVDPELRLFYQKGRCNRRTYFQNVRIDPSIDVSWFNLGEVIGSETPVFSSRPYNEEQAQRIIAHQAQSLRGFQYPTRVHLDLDNCESKPSITPVAPDAPVIYVSSQSGNTITISWLYGFDGGSPITSGPPNPPGPAPTPVWGYTIYTSTGFIASIAPQPCLNSYTLTVASGTEIWITASNCVPKDTWRKGGSTVEPTHCTTLTSGPSNRVMIA
jgi:hypothetical protein